MDRSTVEQKDVHLHFCICVLVFFRIELEEAFIGNDLIRICNDYDVFGVSHKVQDVIRRVSHVLFVLPYLFYTESRLAAEGHIQKGNVDDSICVLLKVLVVEPQLFLHSFVRIEPFCDNVEVDVLPCDFETELKDMLFSVVGCAIENNAFGIVVDLLFLFEV